MYMVLEGVINPLKAKNHAWENIIMGFFYSIIGVFVSYFIFPQYAGMIMVFLMTLAGMPVFFSIIKNEEKIDIKEKNEKGRFYEHIKVFKFFIYLFIGFCSGLTLVYVLLPSNIVNNIFSIQHNTILAISNRVSGSFIDKTGAFVNIFTNNLKVLITCIAFSFIYGAGALFILAWNASVVSAAIGGLIKFSLDKAINPTLLTYLGITLKSILRYFAHGLPEMLAYFIAILAGGIISYSLISRDLFGKHKDKILIDAIYLILLSLVVLLLAAILEVYVTPIFFW